MSKRRLCPDPPEPKRKPQPVKRKPQPVKRIASVPQAGNLLCFPVGLAVGGLMAACTATRLPAVSDSPPGAHAAAGFETRGQGKASRSPFTPDASSKSALHQLAFLKPTFGALDALQVVPERHPLARLTDQQLLILLQQDPRLVLSASLGSPNQGRLLNALQMPNGEHWRVLDPERSWATLETIEFIQTALRTVNRIYPDTHPIYIGDISLEHGGHLAPHRSHQSGRDVDLGYYYVHEPKWYEKAHAKNLDLERTWTLLKALISETDVEYIFIDRSVQDLLYGHALLTGEDPTWLTSVFEYPVRNRRAVVRHVAGHRTHLHVRFHNNLACRTGERIQPHLEKLGI